MSVHVHPESAVTFLRNHRSRSRGIRNWQQLLDEGVVASGTDIAQREGLHHSTVNKLLRLTLLEPAIIQAILAGTQPRCMSLIWFQRNPLPTDWVAQREVVVAFDH